MTLLLVVWFVAPLAYFAWRYVVNAGGFRG
jgi:hypothetical protein